MFLSPHATMPMRNLVVSSPSCANVVPGELQQTSLMTLVDAIKSQNISLAGTAAEALGHVGLRGQLPFTGGYDAKHQQEGVPGHDSTVTEDDALLKSVKMDLEDASLSSLIGRLKELLSSDDIKAVQKVLIAFGHICSGDVSPRLLDLALDSIFSASRSKVEDVLFSAGEALAFIWGGVPVTADEILKSSYTSLSSSSNYLTGEIASHRVDDSLVVEAEVVDDGRVTAREKITRKLFDELLYSSRKEERCTGFAN
eukprot:Gb_39353 [translate_table: standard]